MKLKSGMEVGEKWGRGLGLWVGGYGFVVNWRGVVEFERGREGGSRFGGFELEGGGERFWVGYGFEGWEREGKRKNGRVEGVWFGELISGWRKRRRGRGLRVLWLGEREYRGRGLRFCRLGGVVAEKGVAMECPDSPASSG
ncbi:uncharacterized protein G2W53_014667 [Senna tora]|uniref:Uncharacterized protein n=1 Tax=Senna tora TaxID=362788 RepID=A0A835C4G8_9FABA|nr:uncharacterized protein G2W53_014667 [Senna tora]